jgi:chromosome segregation ATPase
LAEAEQRSEAVSAQYEADIASKCGIISGLRSEIECLSVQLKNALKELPLMEAKIKEDAIVHADKIKELEQEIETLHALKTRSEHLTAEREESQTILNSLELDLSKHKAQLDVLRSENANLSKKLVESESLYKLTCSELEENRMAMADMTKKEATSAELIQKLNSEQGSTVNYMSKQVEELISLRSQNAALKQDLDQLANQTRENQLILSEKDQVVKSLEAKLSELEKEKVIWQKKYRDATAQLANMEKELNNSELKSQELEKKLALTKPSPATAPVGELF